MSTTTTAPVNPLAGIRTRIREQEPAQGVLLEGLVDAILNLETLRVNAEDHERRLAACLAEISEIDSSIDAIRVAIDALGDMTAITIAHELIEARR